MWSTIICIARLMAAGVLCLCVACVHVHVASGGVWRVQACARECVEGGGSPSSAWARVRTVQECKSAGEQERRQWGWVDHHRAGGGVLGAGMQAPLPHGGQGGGPRVVEHARLTAPGGSTTAALHTGTQPPPCPWPDAAPPAAREATVASCVAGQGGGTHPSPFTKLKSRMEIASDTGGSMLPIQGLWGAVGRYQAPA